MFVTSLLSGSGTRLLLESLQLCLHTVKQIEPCIQTLKEGEREGRAGERERGGETTWTSEEKGVGEREGE